MRAGCLLKKGSDELGSAVLRKWAEMPGMRGRSLDL